MNLYQSFLICKNSAEIKIHNKEFYQAQTTEAVEDDTVFVCNREIIMCLYSEYACVPICSRCMYNQSQYKLENI